MSATANSAFGSIREIARVGYRDYCRPRASAFFQGWGRSLLLSRSDLQRSETADISDYFQYDDVETFTCAPPTGIQPLPPTFENEIGTGTLPAPFVTTLSNVDLVGPWCLTVTPGSQYVVEEAEGSVSRLTDILAQTVTDGRLPVHRGQRQASTTIERPAASFVGRFDDEYFHWFTDYLPRVLGLEAYERRTGMKPLCLLPPNPPDWLTQSLAWVGVDPSRWRTYPGGRVYVETLVVPSMRRFGYDDDTPGWSIVSPTSLRTLRDRIRDGAGATPSSGERVYISRDDSTERRVVNEDAVMEVLRERGFERYVLSDLSLADQVKLFARASVVVGPHGAGLTNTIYGEDLTVVELFGETVNPCYYSITTALGFEYAYLCCESIGANLRVDLENLNAILDII